MRLLTRSALMGIVIISCGDSVFGPPPSCSQSDIVTLYPDSLHLVMGAVDQFWVEFGGCVGPPPTTDIDLIIRDPTVAAEIAGFYPANEPARVIQALAPGRTFVVVQVGGFVDSLAVFVPDTVVMGSVSYLAAGGHASCAIAEVDTTMCWGNGSSSVLGQWGVDPEVGTCWGTPCSPMPVPRNTDARFVDVSSSHACTLDDFGGAWCWGDNHARQLGVSSSGSQFDPVPVSGGRVFATLTLGGEYTCGLTSVGAAYCWGDNSGGRLGGDQRVAPIATPELVAGDLQWVSLDARGETTCGVTDAGHLYCWGILRDIARVTGIETCQFSGGKDGPISEPCSYVPLRMILDTEQTADSLFVEVSGPCALTSLGSVFCLEPASGAYALLSGLGPVASISGEDNHTCGLTVAGAAWCWGWNGEGQLGDGTTLYRQGPVAVTGGHTFSQIAVGRQHTCGLTVDGEVRCWGANYLGQAGTSLLSEPWAPVKVRGQD